MKYATGVACLGGALALAACAATMAPRDVPAVITNPTAQSHAELVRVVSSALNGVPLTIADAALTADGTLIIQRAPARDAQGAYLDGRETNRPEHFKLIKTGSQCVLVHERTGQRWTLTSATCAPR